MKALHYGALVKPSVARVLAEQANATLGPVLIYLKQIIQTERERQRRYPMKWERVREPYVLQLEPRDTVVELQAPPPALRVTNWPEGRALPGKDVPLIVVRPRSSEQLTVLDCTLTPAGPLVTAQPPPLETDLVFWDGVQCALVPTERPQVPSVLLDMKGRTWPVRRVIDGKEPLSWRLIVEGRIEGPLQLAQSSWQGTLADPLGGLRSVVDAEGLPIPFEGSLELRVDTLPAAGLLVGNNGVRFAWDQKDRRQGRGSGVWIQLLIASPTGEESTVDPRTFFCEDGVDEVWTETSRKDSVAYRVRDVRRDQYRLRLDRLPPEAATLLYLPVGHNPKVQRRAVFQLRDSPLPHHRGLLRLTEDPQRALSERPGCERVPWEREPLERPRVDTWRVLTDLARSGTDQQREFVRCALGTPEFAFLEGPPGSGKTTAICELVLQLIERKQTILLCATTHFAIDNVLERLTGYYPEVEAVRIGRTDRVDPSVRGCQLDERVTALLESWRNAPGLSGRGEGELKSMAERIVLASANLTCATTMGIGAHPVLRGEGPSGGEREERPHTRGAHFDVLIIDEASKTTLQEFLVPALLARRWIIVGDVRQLPPFAERADLEANLRSPVDEQERPVFPEAHQRACLLRFRLLRGSYREQVRWLLVEEPAVLEALQKEALADPERRDDLLVRVVARRSTGGLQASAQVTVEELERGRPEALRLSTAQWVLVEPTLLARVERYLPSDLLAPREGSVSAGTAFQHRQAHWLARAQALRESFRERGKRIEHLREAQAQEQEFLAERSWANEVAWRLTRVHELRRSRDQDEVSRLRRQLDGLLPQVGRERVREYMNLLADISLPSVLESLQLGVRADKPKRRSYLFQGLGQAWSARAVCLTHQHRMHADISAFPRKVFYEDAFLKDEPSSEPGDETVARRDATHHWSFGARLPARRLWVDVAGRELKGTNSAEVDAMRDVIQRFLAWAAKNPHAKARDGKRWEVACLSFYVRQEAALRDMLQQVTQTQDKHTHRFDAGHAEIVCGTVDRFQGREADLVLLSMRNTARVGFLDSPNRLNVGLTRARRQLLVFGQRNYFSHCDVVELERLANETVSLPPTKLLERMDG